MKIINSIALFTALLTTMAWATTPVQHVMDEVAATGGSTLTMPTVGSSLITDSNTITLTNKTLTTPTIQTGASLSGTFTGTPIFSGALSMTGGPSISGSGSITDGMDFVNASDTTKKLVFSLSGNTTGKVLTISTSQTNSETLAMPNVSSGDTIATQNATQTFGSGSTWNGQPIGPSYGGASFVVNDSVASPQSVGASGITLSTPGFFNQVFIAGASSGSNVVTQTPSITACTSSGQMLQVVSESSTNFVTLQNNADLAGSGLLLNGPWISGKNNGTPYVLTLQCDTAFNWVEVSRSN